MEDFAAITMCFVDSTREWNTVVVDETTIRVRSYTGEPLVYVRHCEDGELEPWFVVSWRTGWCLMRYGEEGWETYGDKDADGGVFPFASPTEALLALSLGDFRRAP